MAASETVNIKTADGEMSAYVARPAKGSGPALVLLQEIFGVNAFMKSMADRFAEEGYVAIVPDLFWRLEPGVSLGYGEDDIKKGLELRGRFDVDKAMEDVQATITAARAMDGVAGKVGTLGFCLGGLLAYLAATRTDTDVSVGYYGVAIEKHLGEADKIKVPLVLHIGSIDTRCPPDAQEAIKAGLKDKAEIYVYDGADHAFAAPARPSYDKPSTWMAYTRTLTALKRVMGPCYNIEEIWDLHTYHEFATRDVEATMATMVGDPYVNHVPTMTGGTGYDAVKAFYTAHFVHSNAEDTKVIPISRTIGTHRVVDEMLFCFTHTREIDWILPGVPPTGKYVEVPLVGVVGFRGGKVWNEHIYWDQASVLVQIGLLDPTGLPVSGAEQAAKFMDEHQPSNTLINKAKA